MPSEMDDFRLTIRALATKRVTFVLPGDVLTPDNVRQLIQGHYNFRANQALQIAGKRNGLENEETVAAWAARKLPEIDQARREVSAALDFFHLNHPDTEPDPFA